MKTRELQARVDAIEQRLEQLDHRCKAMEDQAVEVTLHKTLVGDLKFEIEQMQEA